VRWQTVLRQRLGHSCAMESLNHARVKSSRTTPSRRQTGPAPETGAGLADNRLIALLPSKDRLRLRACGEPVELVPAQVLCEPGRPTRHVYFPIDGSISLVTNLDRDSSIEVGMVGREGMLGIQLALGVAIDSLHAEVQAPGDAWRIDRAAFRREVLASAALHRVLQRYVHVLISQLATSVACSRFHLIGARLACWLLMSQDRTSGERMQVTHEFLARVLGVQRAGVTRAASSLQRRGLIEYRRGNVEVLDRKALQGEACACYATHRRIYADSMR
jgi:CRP-like cAMP-binding protein